MKLPNINPPRRRVVPIPNNTLTNDDGTIYLMCDDGTTYLTSA